MRGRNDGLRRTRLEGADGSENQLVRLLFVGHRIGRPVVDAAVRVEVDAQTPDLLVAVAAAQVVDIVPAALVELVLHQRNAEQELHLRVRHAFFELKRHFTRDQIALVDISTVRFQEVRHEVSRAFPGTRDRVGDRAAARKADGARKRGA